MKEVLEKYNELLKDELKELLLAAEVEEQKHGTGYNYFIGYIKGMIRRLV